MPKHHIYPTANPDGTGSDRRLEVHWQRQGEVLVGSTRWAGKPGEADMSRGHLAPATEHDPALPAWFGSLISLDREKLNHLIRQLRAARDQAFGKDE